MGRFSQCLLAIVTICSSAKLLADELKAFQLTGVEGAYTVRYFFDEQMDSTDRETNTGEIDNNINNLLSSEIKKIGVNIQTHSFIYHPNFLTMNIGGGPVMVENLSRTYTAPDARTGGGGSGIGEGLAEATLYNFNANFNFFAKKSYPFSFYVNRSNPLIVPRYDEHFLQKNTKYGAKFSLRNWALPVELIFEAFKLSSKGRGNRIIVDNEVDEVNVRMNQSLSFGGYRQLLIQSNRYKSRSDDILVADDSGSDKKSNVLTNSMNYNSRTVMGAHAQLVLTNTFTLVEQNLKPQLRQLKYSPQIRWEHSKTLHSYFRADYISNIQDDIEIKQQSVRFGYAKTNEKLGSNSANLQAKQEISEGFRIDSESFSILADYAFKLSFLKLNTHVGFGYGLFEQVTDDTASSRNAPIDRFVLEIGRPVKLRSSNIIESSIEVYVNKGTSTPTESRQGRKLILGVHYSINQSSNGVITTMTHLIDPDPATRYSGEVIVYYDYMLGGSFSYEKTDQQYQIGMAFSRYMSIFAGLSKTKNGLVNGEPQFALQDVNSSNFGFRFELPVTDFLTIGGDTRTEEERAGLTPNLRVSKNAYLQFKLFNSTYLQLLTQTTTVDYKFDDILGDIDIIRYSVRLRSRPSRRSLMSLSAVGERDLATAVPRESINILFKWKWNYRKLFFSLDAKSKLETQGANNYNEGIKRQERKLLRVTLERRF